MTTRPRILAAFGLLLACSVSVSSSTSPPPEEPKTPPVTDDPPVTDEPSDSDDAVDPTRPEDQGMTQHAPSPDEAWVGSPADLETLGLRSQGEEGEALLAAVVETIGAGLEDAEYGLLFTAEPSELAPVVDAEGRGLELLRRVAREQPTCTTAASVEAGSGGGTIRAATKGICGGIACMHSALEIGLLERDQVVAGKHFEERWLRKLQGRDRKNMKFDRLQEVHEELGAKKCQIRGGERGFDTGNAGGLGRFNKDLSRFVNDRKHDWDCTILVRTMHRGKWVLAHYEKVESVRRSADGTTTIKTANGLDQGNQTDRVPASPGTNTWTSKPGGTPPFSLTGSTHKDAAKYKKLPAVGSAKFLCCRKP